jgi:glycosyltransferase involved in cell wall biosynthesis
MRIAMYNARLPVPGRKPGGVEVYVHRLASALVEGGHDVVVHAYVAPADAALPYRVRRLGPRRLGTSKVGRQYVGSWLMNVQGLQDCDVLHLHGDDWFFLQRDVPTVRTFHGSALFEAITAATPRRRVDQLVVFGLEQLSRRLATAAFGVGPDSELVVGRDGTLASGIDLPEDATSSRSTAPSILFVGTWAGRKRGGLLWRAFNDVIRPAVPEAELWMVSDHAEPAEGVRWHPHVSDAELHELYRGAWVFCLPSAYEGFGLPYLEAMSHGVPVVSTPNFGALSVLDGAGRLVAATDVGRALVELLHRPDLRAELSSQGRARAGHFAWSRVVEDHERAYRLATDRWSRRATRVNARGLNARRPTR